MQCVRQLLFMVFMLGYGPYLSQDYFSFPNSNYGGVSQMVSNPAAASCGKLKIDVAITGYNLNFSNTWVGIKPEAISFPQLPGSWKNYTPNLPDNVYKNFNWRGGTRSRRVMLEQRLMLPSAMIRINPKNSVGFISSIRQLANITGVSEQLANLFQNEFDLSVLQNNHVQNRDFMAKRMSWLELGLVYSRQVLSTRRHQLSAAVSPKLLVGLEAAYFHLRELDFYFTNNNSSSYLDADFSVGHSARTGSWLDLSSNLSNRIGHASDLKAGLDLGLCYQFLRSGPVSGNDVPVNANTSPQSDYILKVGLSLVDIGSVTYQKEPDYYDMQMHVEETDIVRYISAQNIQMIDSLLRTDYPANTGDDQFTMGCPTALNCFADISFTKNVYLGVNGHFNVVNPDDLFRLRNQNSVSLVPRFEMYWLEAALLLNYRFFMSGDGKRLVPGFSLRLGPLSLGSGDLSFIAGDDLSTINFFILLKLSIPQK